MLSDTALLQQYARTRDAEAFAELVRRHAGMVYGACLRVLHNADDAEDVAQECFIELARKAEAITTSLPGWLHALACSRAIDTLRKESTRKRYEEQAMSEDMEDSEPVWANIAPYVDEALAALPEELRAPVLLHFFEGRTQSEVAKVLGLSQSTVSRRIDKGIAELRERLKQAGVTVSVTVLAVLLAGHAATAAPAVLLASLTKAWPGRCRRGSGLDRRHYHRFRHPGCEAHRAVGSGDGDYGRHRGAHAKGTTGNEYAGQQSDGDADPHGSVRGGVDE